MKARGLAASLYHLQWSLAVYGIPEVSAATWRSEHCPREINYLNGYSISYFLEGTAEGLKQAKKA